MSSSKEILAEANAVIHGERAESYGPAEVSFARIGALWSAYLGVDVNAYDVAMLMTLLKVSRAKTDIKRDTFVDIAGYAALAERCAVEAGLIDEQPVTPYPGGSIITTGGRIIAGPDFTPAG